MKKLLVLSVVVSLGCLGTMGFFVLNTTTRSDLIDIVADCGAVGDGVTDNQAAIANCEAAHPYGKFFFPPIYYNASTGIQARYFHSGTWTVGPHVSFESTGSAYNQGLGAIILSPAGVDSIYITGAGQLLHINIEGSEPASTYGGDTANLIFPSGSILSEYQVGLNAIGTSNGITTLLMLPAQAFLVPGIITVQGLPAPFTAINGTYHILAQCAGMRGPCNRGGDGWVQIFTGAPDQIPTHLEAGAFVLPGTTGNSAATGVTIKSSFVKLDDVDVAYFGNNCIENNGIIGGDDLLMTNTRAEGCRAHGFYAHGRDTNASVITGFTTYFNQLFGVFDTTSLNSTYITPQASYNHSGALTWSASPPGTPYPIASCTRSAANLLDCMTVGTNPYKQGQGILITGMSDPSYNAIVINGETPSVSCFISSIVSSKEFQCTEPIYQALLSAGSATGGQVQLGSRSQIYFGSSLWGGAYWIDVANDTASLVMINPYDEGGQGQSNNGCANFFGADVTLLGHTFGDGIDANAKPGLMLGPNQPYSVRLGAQ